MFSVKSVIALAAAATVSAPAAQIELFRGHQIDRKDGKVTLREVGGEGRFFSLPVNVFSTMVGISSEISNVDLKKLLVSQGGCKNEAEAARYIERSVSGFGDYNGFISLLQAIKHEEEGKKARRAYLPVKGQATPAQMLTTGPRPKLVTDAPAAPAVEAKPAKQAKKA